MSDEQQSSVHDSEVAPENAEDLQEQTANPEASLLKSPSEESESSTSSGSSSQSSKSQNPDGNPMPDTGEATTESPYGESSLGENIPRIDEGNVDDFKSERTSESNQEDLFSPSSAQASENDGYEEFPDAAELFNNVSPSSTRQEGKEEKKKLLNTMETQTTWISLDTPGSSVAELEMEIPKLLKSHSLDSKSWKLDFLTDSEKGGSQKKFASEESFTESFTDFTLTETRSEESDYEETDYNSLDFSERTRWKTGRSKSILGIQELKTERINGFHPDMHFQVAVVKTSKVVHCEFCKQERMPFPTPQQLDTTTPDKLFCCNMSWELYQQILRKREEDPDYSEPDSDEEVFHTTLVEMEEAEKKIMERIKNTEITMYMTTMVHGDEVIFTTMKTISYKLSSEQCRKQGWTLGIPRAKPVKVEDFSRYVPVAKSYKEDVRPDNIVEKYYPNGRKFLIMFPDGTFTVFYPSGNIAIQASPLLHDQLVYIIFEDLDWNVRMLGVFQSTGHGTCYHPNRHIWINLTPLHGLYFTEQGVVKMHWQWRDYAYHVHAPPYNSISLKLSPFISIHIISRDQVYVTFKRMKRRIRFNVGAKLVPRNLEQSHAAQSRLKGEKYIKKAKEKINMLLKQLRERE
ncbi:glutamate-rich protein 6-like [Leucoraja erinacea]|uniref:glutamate-rich protein 6-like n=1 Tax=Leucoraja erinaceus TaxID=7782 RepID=UPI0024581BEC|nr:glutamate-rich protein 6-like [Leucoraja erinacea]XP_055500789.1 glutamate-rich protein 6-like [Leucoraja erinacea]XP_055500790.1 glutamate-rich protein 6-like [Leucoraja erinacea]XP_055500791.1 glutamate-rich protein 6-like [Leucoraja erinacea]XP_055500792.1 glutamate-rich protein 6-like [Leucoraja erinacea]